MLPTVIVENDAADCQHIIQLLHRHCPDVLVTNQCQTGNEALQSIEQALPALVLMEVELPGLNGFELLEKLSHLHFDVIITSNNGQHAAKAFQYNVADYLLKPVDVEQLLRAIHRVKMRIEERLHEQLEQLIQKIDHLKNNGQLALPTFEGLQMVHIDDIICCASESNYTKVHLKGVQKLVVSKTLGDVEEMLKDAGFIRVHHSYLVNMNEIQKYLKLDGGQLVMSDGSIVYVSRHKRDLLLKKLTHNK